MKNCLQSMTLQEYMNVMQSGMFWELFPDATGYYEIDVKQHQDKEAFRPFESVKKCDSELEKTKEKLKEYMSAYMELLDDYKKLQTETREIALEALSADGQAMESYEELIECKESLEVMRKALVSIAENSCYNLYDHVHIAQKALKEYALIKNRNVRDIRETTNNGWYDYYYCGLK